MLNSFFMSLGFASLGLALPAPSTLVTRNGPNCHNFSSASVNFDDLSAPAGAPALAPVPAGYNGLLFQSFSLVSVSETPFTPGVVPQSGNNYAFSGTRTMTTAGSAEWTTNYAGSVVKAFSPQSFYYGCILDAGNGATALPTACNIAITGYAQGDNTNEAVQVVSQEFNYNPSTATGPQQMVQGIFNWQFTNLQYVLIQYTLPGGTSAASAELGMLIDNVVYNYCG